MKCRLDKNKIELGIIDAVKELAVQSSLFNIDNNILSAKNEVKTDIPNLTDEQLKMVDDVFKYKDEIKGLYKTSFESDPELFLHEIAEQANSSTSEKEGAIGAVGENIVNLALKIFPKVGLKSFEENIIADINKQFTREVITRIGLNQWKIDIPEELVVKYLLGQSGGFAHITDYLRATYLKQFTSSSLNLIGDNLWLNHPFLQDPSVQDMLNFMKKLNPNARVAEFDNLDRNGVALIRDYTILIKRGAMIEELPHEVSHFFTELLPDEHPLKMEMMAKIIDMPLYSEIYKKYSTDPAYQKNGRPDIDKIKREAIAQQIGEYVKAAYRNEADAKYGKKRGWLRQMAHDFFKFLRKLFHINSPAIYTEPLFDANSPFIKAANQIIQGDISNLNVKKVMSVYDSVFFDNMEEETPETYEAGDIIKAMYEFTKAIKKQIAKVFRVNVESKNMKALIEELQDPANKDYNRIFDIISRFAIAGDLLKDIMENPTDNNHRLLKMLNVAQNLGDTYRSMETIPDAMNAAIKKMQTSNTIDKLLDNVSELQAYSTFATSFKTITDEFQNMLSYIKDKWPSETEGLAIYDKMLNNMGNVTTNFAVSNKNIENKLTTHLAKITDKWMDGYIHRYKAELQRKYDTVKGEVMKAKLREDMHGTFIGEGAQIMRALTGNFSQTNFDNVVDKAGNIQKVDIEKLKDATSIDKLVFLTSSPTMLSDPFLSNAVAYFYDQYAIYQYKGQMQAKEFADSVLPLIDELEKQGIGYYNANLLIQNIQSFYTPFSETNEVLKRCLLAETNSFNFNFHKQQKWKAIYSMQKELNILYSTGSQDEISAKEAEIEKLKDEFNKWLGKVAYRPFTDDYYDKLALLKENKNDSPVLKEMKDIRKKLLILEQHQYAAFMIDETFRNKQYDELTEKIARLRSKLIVLSDKLPDVEKTTYDITNDLYEIDELRTSRLLQGHRNRTVTDVVSHLIDIGRNAIYNSAGKQIGTKTRDEIQKEVGEKYDALYTLNVPKQEFYDARTKIFDELNGLLGKNIAFKAMQDRIQQLSDKERKYIKQLRDFRGDADMSSLKQMTVKDDNGTDVLFSKVLKQMEGEIDMLRSRTGLYSQVLNQVEEPETREKLLAWIDMITGLTLISQNSIIYKAEDVKRIFSDYIGLTDSQAQQILSAIQKTETGDNSDFQNLSSLNPTFKTKGAEIAFATLKEKAFTTLENLDNAEEIMYRSFSQLKRSSRTDEQQARLESLYQQLGSLYQNSVSFQYSVVMHDFYMYLEQYLNDDSFNSENKWLHRSRVEDRSSFDMALTSDIEKFMGDGLFESTLSYMKMLEANEKDPDEGYPLADLIDYYISIHKRKSYFSEGEHINTWTPISYVRNAIVDPLLTDKKPPRFLTQSKVRDKFVVQKRNEMDEDVLSGKEKATVDINGQWLPLPTQHLEDGTENPYWSKEYNNLKNTNPTAFKLLIATRHAYLTKQLDLDEGDRLDGVLPARHIDKFEEKKFMLTQAKGMWSYIRNAVPLLGSKKAQVEEQNYLEDIGQTTIKNNDIYTGLAINNETVKLRSSRTMPIERVSEDAIAGVAMFFEDMNEWSAKTEVEPIFKAFRDVFTASRDKAIIKGVTNVNANRAEIFNDMYNTKILDKIPVNILNNPFLAKATQLILKLTGMRLMMDLPGGAINFLAGNVQMFIEANMSKSAWANYLKSSVKAGEWLKDFDYDFWQQSNWGLNTQLIAVFNMIPTPHHVSHQLSMKALYSSIRSKMMAPRTEGEKLMAIQTGLGVMLSRNVVFNGEHLSVDELYELGPDGFIRLKDIYKSLEEDWNPLDGKQVVLVRRELMQLYTILQGNYYPTNKPWISYTTAGQWGLALKQWFPSNFLRRMHGRVNDPFLQRERMGNHYAMGNLIGNLAQAFWNRDAQHASDYWNVIAKSPQEQLALRRSLAEFLWTAIFGMIVFFGFGYDYDDKDKNKKLREMGYLKQLMLLVMMRVGGEVGTFIPLPMWGLGYMEMKRAIMDPIGLPRTTVDNMSGILKLTMEHILQAFGQDYSRELYYQNGKSYSYNFGGLGAFKDKGDSKLFALLFNTIGYTGYTFEPAVYMQTYNSMQNRIK